MVIISWRIGGKDGCIPLMADNGLGGSRLTAVPCNWIKSFGAIPELLSCVIPK
jgi:hypothetical protein